MKNTYVLAFDCTANTDAPLPRDFATVAVHNGQQFGGGAVVKRTEQSQKLVPEIMGLLSNFKAAEKAHSIAPGMISLTTADETPALAIADLGAIMTTIGPGSFTGLRIGLATAHGLSQASGVPLKIITTTEAVAWHIKITDYATKGTDHFLIALDAGKGEAFMQEFSIVEGAVKPMGPITLHPRSIIETVSLPCFGNLWPYEHPNFIAGPNAYVMTAVAHRFTPVPLTEAVPYYIRPADAKIPQKPHWLAN